tara:strand:- start:2974 stop:3345 length:372 start_codon:yes stop_codon:yes gene_type:complete
VRDWLHVEDHVKALWCLLERGQLGEHYNIGGDCPKTNAEVVTAICAHLDAMSPSTKPAGSHASLIRHVADRPGHDWRYALDSSKMQARDGVRRCRSSKGCKTPLRFTCSIKTRRRPGPGARSI